ncbi:MAG: protein translocase subunit secA [Patescibacteria group bacterium]|nr:protein translocase subunit secA [Patescibacteria group bacterium]
MAFKDKLDKLFGDDSSRFLKYAKPIVEKINSLEEETVTLTDADFPLKTAELKARIAEGESLDSIIPEAFTLVREAAKRTLGQRHFDVQLIGGLALCQGKIAEMRTGEGKTLVGTLAAYTNALTGRGVHVVTVNDYLARRDTQEMGQVYHFLGMTTGVLNNLNISYLYNPSVVKPDPETVEAEAYKIFEEFLKPCTKQEAYRADITYGTNSEFGFDYLRDNTQLDANNVAQRGHFFALVDEVDSILIDEARVPLILSGPSDDASLTYKTSASIAKQLIPDVDYEIDEKLKAIQLTDEGITHAEKLLGVDNLYTAQNVKLVHHLETAVRAQALFKRDDQYVVRNGEVLIVDSFTGRIQEGRRYSDGLHQALEAKEGVDIKQESRTLASITYQNYFKFYEKLSGMTGTAKTSAEEFLKVYNLEVIVVPTHREIKRIDHNDLILQSEEGKFKAIAKTVKGLHDKGQPVLIGTVSVEKNELLSAYLRGEGIPHELLNAKNNDREAGIIANAGRKGSVVIATNMAGRGVDIKLGGVPFDKEKAEEVKALGGLYVIGTERHEARRIDNQLRGRSGRQGDPGETQFFVSLDDNLMRVFGGDKVKGMIGSLGLAPEEPIQHGFISRQLENAQEKIEGFNFDSRKSILSYDDVLSTQRSSIYGRRNKLLHNDADYLAELAEQVKARSANVEELETKKEKLGDEVWTETLRRVAMMIIDRLWTDHLDMMDNARASVNLRAYGQREPIVEYKREGLTLFRELEENYLNQVADIMTNLDTDGAAQSAAMPISIMLPSAKADGTKYERNDKIIVTKDGEEREVKFKKLAEMIGEGWEVKTHASKS